MSLVIITFAFLAQSVLASDTGDGSDGTCDVTGAATTQITSARKSYQCTTLIINGNLAVFNGAGAGAGGDALVIKVQNDVTIDSGFTLDLRGAPGIAGNTTVGVKLGGLGGAGGSAGGNTPGVGVNGESGGGTGGGLFGDYVEPVPTTNSSYGGGGGGGSYKNKAGVEPQDGHDSVNTIVGSSGVNGSVYGSEATFNATFSGGSGGGAGGGGKDGTAYTGSTGGGGGGALRIISGGNITINGIILLNGGVGGGGELTTNAGGGGGGSGGGLWLQAAGTLTVNGTLSAVGGARGMTDLGGDIDKIGAGGNGGQGRIRLDDADGVITNNGTITPAAYSTRFPPTREYSSGIACASISLDDQDNFSFLMNVILGFSLVAGLILIEQKLHI